MNKCIVLIFFLFSILQFSFSQTIEINDFSIIYENYQIEVFDDILETLKKITLNETKSFSVNQSDMPNRLLFISDDIQFEIYSGELSNKILVIKATSDNVKTFRGITIGDKRSAVKDLYPLDSKKIIVKENDKYLWINCVIKDGVLVDNPSEIINSFYPEDFISLTMNFIFKGDIVNAVELYVSFEM